MPEQKKVKKEKSVPPLGTDFLFGVGNSAHQVEAYDARYEDIHDIWEKRETSTPRDKATDFCNRYTEDIRLARELGCKLFRFSVAWSCLEPEQGEYNQEYFNYYKNLIREIKAAGMEPMLTLLHFTWPLHVAKRGGFLNSEFPDIFASFTEKVVEQLGEGIRYWITFNEPNVLLYGYVKPWWETEYFFPPGLNPAARFSDQMEAAARVMKYIFLAHTFARKVILEKDAAAQVAANPAILGLPRWLNSRLNKSVTKLKNIESLTKTEQGYAEKMLQTSGKVDLVIATLTRSRERENEIAYSDVYYVASQKILVNAASPIRSKVDLKAKKVGVMKSSTAEHAVIFSLPESKFQIFNDYSKGLKLLDSGKISGIVADDVILRGFIKNFPDRYRLLEEPLTKEPYGIGMTRGHETLITAVNKALENFKQSGKWQESYRKHISATDNAQPPQGYLSVLSKLDESLQNELRETHPPRSIVPPESSLAQIKKRGYLTVGIKGDLPGFSQQSASGGGYEGFEIDIARHVAAYIFNDPSKVEFVPVVTRKRIAFLQSFTKVFDPLNTTLSMLTSIFNSNWWYLGMAGKLPAFLCPPECVGQFDLVGFDYYWGIGTLKPKGVSQLMAALLDGEFTNAPVWPEGMYNIIQDHSTLFPDKEIFIVENGCVDFAGDVSRIQYMQRHIAQLQRAHSEGMKVKGYVYWSITSNREWGHAFGPNTDFGLYHINLDGDPELKRIPTPAAEYYGQVIRSRGVE